MLQFFKKRHKTLKMLEWWCIYFRVLKPWEDQENGKHHTETSHPLCQYENVSHLKIQRYRRVGKSLECIQSNSLLSQPIHMPNPLSLFNKSSGRWLCLVCFNVRFQHGFVWNQDNAESNLKHSLVKMRPTSAPQNLACHITLW